MNIDSQRLIAEAIKIKPSEDGQSLKLDADRLRFRPKAFAAATRSIIGQLGPIVQPNLVFAGIGAECRRIASACEAAFELPSIDLRKHERLMHHQDCIVIPVKIDGRDWDPSPSMRRKDLSEALSDVQLTEAGVGIVLIDESITSGRAMEAMIKVFQSQELRDATKSEARPDGLKFYIHALAVVAEQDNALDDLITRCGLSAHAIRAAKFTAGPNGALELIPVSFDSSVEAVALRRLGRRHAERSDNRAYCMFSEGNIFVREARRGPDAPRQANQRPLLTQLPPH